MILHITTPIISKLEEVFAGTRVLISGTIYTGRDAVLPKIAKLHVNGSLKTFPVSLQGAAIMHTAFSPSGFGPTSSNKEEIEGTMGALSQAGVRLHIGKGVIKKETVAELSKYGAIFVVMPPVSALLQSRLVSSRVVAFSEEGVEAMYALEVKDLPGIIAAANGISIFH